MANETEEKWEPKDFTRRDYEVSGPHLDRAKKIRVQVIVDGRKEIDFQLREPGLLAIVSRPDSQGISVELVEPTPGGAAITDMDSEPGERREPRQWQVAALLGPKR